MMFIFTGTVMLVVSDCLQAPSIVETFPKDVVIAAGDPVSLTCSSSGIPSPIVRWIKMEHPSFDHVPAVSIGNGSATLSINSFTTNEEGYYVCIALNPVNVAHSVAILLRLATTAIEDISFGKVQLEYLWEDTVLECHCRPRAADFLWFKMDNEITESAKATSPLLFFPSIADRDQDHYICIVVDDIGISYSVTEMRLSHLCAYSMSSSIPLVVGVHDLRPTITTAPVEHTTKSPGDYLLLQCCSSDHLPNISWLRIDAAMPPKVAGVDSTRLFVPNISSSDVGKYICVARNSNGIALSRSAELQLTESHDDNSASDLVVNQTVFRILNQTATLDCCVSHALILEYNWYPARGSFPGKVGGVSSKILVIPDLTFNETKLYVCLAVSHNTVHMYTVNLIVTDIPYHPTDAPTSDTPSTHITPSNLPTDHHSTPNIEKEEASIIMVAFSSGIGLVVIFSLSVFTFLYVCCKKGLFGNSAPSYMRLQEISLWDIITGRHKEGFFTQMIQIMRPNYDMFEVEAGKERMSWYYDWWRESESLRELSITTLQRPYDD